MVCAGFPRRRRIEASRVITTSSDGGALDAGARTGQIYALLGTTTRAVIARLLCAAVSPVRYFPLGPINWLQADGDEFTGVFKPTALGAATFAWGAGAGDRATAGLVINGDGVVVIDGLIRFPQRTQIKSIVRLSDLSMVAGNGAWVGLVRDAAPTTWVGGGLGVNATPAYCCAAFLGSSLTTPTLTANTAFGAAPSTALEHWIINQNALYVASPHAGWSWGQISAEGGTEGYVAAQAVGALAGISTVDRRVAFGGRGGIKARHLVTEISGGAL